MTSQYFEFYSAGRDRVKYPNPASYEIIANRTSQNAVDVVSNQLVEYPNPLESPPLVFYTEYIYGEEGLTTSFTNLPFMYSTALGGHDRVS